MNTSCQRAQSMTNHFLACDRDLCPFAPIIIAIPRCPEITVCTRYGGLTVTVLSYHSERTTYIRIRSIPATPIAGGGVTVTQMEWRDANTDVPIKTFLLVMCICPWYCAVCLLMLVWHNTEVRHVQSNWNEVRSRSLNIRTLKFLHSGFAVLLHFLDLEICN